MRDRETCAGRKERQYIYKETKYRVIYHNKSDINNDIYLNYNHSTSCKIKKQEIASMYICMFIRA